MSRKKSSTPSRDRVSLNPEREAADDRDAEAALQDVALKEQIESAWYCMLHNGEHLRKQRCDAARYRAFVERSGFSTSDRHMNIALRNFGMQAGDDDFLTLPGFVKTLLHLAADRFQLPHDRLAALKSFVEAYVVPFTLMHRSANAHDGTGPDDALLCIPEIDRLLYVYDSVFERMFVRYRDVDHHQTRELTLDQVKILDQFLEVEEVKELLKDFGIFPKMVSFVELSRACQWTCFGRIVIDPTKQGAARTSNIEAPRKESGQVGLNLATDAENPAVNALFVPQLPQEYQANEVLLDKPRFMTCIIRLAQMIYNKPDYAKSLPSVVSRVEELLLFMSSTYEKMFSKTMESDCDFSEKGVPLLNNVSASSALSPDTGSMQGGFEIVVNGSNFCEKRGVFVRFGSSGRVVVRAKQIQKKRVTVDAPQMSPEDVEIDVDFQHGEYHLHLQKIVKVAVECSNNRWQYSETDPTQYFTFRDKPTQWTIGVELSTKLMKLFGAVCSMGDTKKQSKRMNREKWRTFKTMAHLSEAIRHTRDISATSGSSTDEDNDLFFLEVAEYHTDGENELSLAFKGFLRVVARTLYEMHGETEWFERISEAAALQLTTQRHVVEAGPVVEQNEMVLARRAISMVERRSILELDVFMGPVLCGVLRSRPGDVLSSYSGRAVVHLRGHGFLSYDHMEINTEVCVLRHLQLSQSLPHFLQRLRKDGFDFAAHHPKPNTRKPAGRCWTVHLSDVCVGALWDYEGNFSCMEWQPADKELFHAKMTMTMYEEERSPNFVACYLHFSKAKDVQQLRSILEAKGFALKTKLYRVP